MFFAALSSAVLLAPLVASVAVPATDLATRSAKAGGVLTGQFQCEAEDASYYLLCTNLWGQSSASGGSWQTAQMTTSSSDNVAWTTSYDWIGGSGLVKSYANVALQHNLPVQLSNVANSWTNWQWSYTSQSNIVADVSYDIWFAASAVSPPSAGQAVSGVSTYEIMIWLGQAGGIDPIGSPIATVSIAGYTWQLWKGPNQGWTVFSFLRQGADITNFSADLNGFYQYLINSQGVSKNQYLVSLESGTEPMTGSATLTTSLYNVAVNAL